MRGWITSFGRATVNNVAICIAVAASAVAVFRPDALQGNPNEQGLHPIRIKSRRGRRGRQPHHLTSWIATPG